MTTTPARPQQFPAAPDWLPDGTVIMKDCKIQDASRTDADYGSPRIFALARWYSSAVTASFL
jgi:hypothetical protein